MISSYSTPPQIIVNLRCLSAPVTGVQRYTAELLSRLPGLERVSPSRPLPGVKGHLWEQFALPSKLGAKALLWSPANTGPLGVQRQVVSIHDLSAIEHPEWYTPRFATWYGFLLPSLARKVHKIITMSEFSKARMVELWRLPPDKIIVTPEGVAERFHPRELSLEVRQSLSLPTGPYLLALGSLEPRKNLARLLKAWEIIQPQLPDDLWLVLAGGKGLKRVFQDVGLRTLPPRVHQTGYFPEEALPALYSSAQAFLYPSLYEGFGLPPLEAMACGTPVLTSGNTSIPEVTGSSALLIDPDDIESLCAGIKQIVADGNLRERLSTQGRHRSQLFRWETCAMQTWQVLQETI